MREKLRLEPTVDGNNHNIVADVKEESTGTLAASERFIRQQHEY